MLELLVMETLDSIDIVENPPNAAENNDRHHSTVSSSRASRMVDVKHFVEGARRAEFGLEMLWVKRKRWSWCRLIALCMGK